jgi:hypothetical protein
MPVKKKPSAAQLAARAKFVKMVRAKAAAKKKAATKVGAYKKPKLFKPTKKQTEAAVKRLVKQSVAVKKVSSIGSTDSLHKEIIQTQTSIIGIERLMNENVNNIKIASTPYHKTQLRKQNIYLKQLLSTYKKQLLSLKKMYQKSIK